MKMRAVLVRLSAGVMKKPLRRGLVVRGEAGHLAPVA